MDNTQSQQRRDDSWERITCYTSVPLGLTLYRLVLGLLENWKASKLSRIENDRLVPSPYFIYLLFKDDERLGRNDIIVRIAGYAGKDDKKLGKLPERISDFP